MNPIALTTNFLKLLLRLNPARVPLSPADPHTLRELSPGSRGRVVGFDLPPEKSHRLLEMGLTKGTLLQVVRLAPLGDPIEVKVRGYHLVLRKNEAAGIRIAAEREP